MGCCGVSVKDDPKNNNKANNRYIQIDQSNQNNTNNQSINIYTNPLKSTKISPNQRHQTPLTNNNNNNTNNNANNNSSMEHISFHSTLKRPEQPKKTEKVKKYKNLNILDNVKEYLPDDITKDEIEEMVMSAIGDNLVKNEQYKKGVNLTSDHIEALVDILYMTVIGRNNGDKNYEDILEDIKLKIGFVDVNKDSVRNIMFRGQNPTDDDIEQVLEQFKKSYNPKLFVIELLD